MSDTDELVEIMKVLADSEEIISIMETQEATIEELEQELKETKVNLVEYKNLNRLQASQIESLLQQNKTLREQLAELFRSVNGYRKGRSIGM